MGLPGMSKHVGAQNFACEIAVFLTFGKRKTKVILRGSAQQVPAIELRISALRYHQSIASKHSQVCKPSNLPWGTDVGEHKQPQRQRFLACFFSEAAYLFLFLEFGLPSRAS